MTIRQVLREGTASLKEAGFEEAETDAWLLLAHVSGLDRTGFLLRGNESLPSAQEEAYRTLIGRRMEHIPVQHLTGTQDFMGFSFLVNEHVLIPRWDTEILVEEALRRFRPGMRVLDLCTGSGCIIISLALLSHGKTERKDRDGALFYGADLSEQALETARENARRLDAGVTFFRGDLFRAVEKEPPYDMIVTNPPYIRTGDIEALSEEVRLHDPRMALDGHEDGLFFYRKIARQAQAFLKPGGHLLLEIGFDQAQDVTKLLAENGYRRIRVIQDLSGLDRVVCAESPDANKE